MKHDLKKYPGLYRLRERDPVTGEMKPSKIIWMSFTCAGCVVHPRGGRHRESSGKENVTEALRELNRRKGAVADDRELPRKNEIRMGELLQGVVDSYIAKGNRSLPDVRDMLKNDLLPFFQGYRAVDVCMDESVIRSFIVKLKEEGKADATVNRRLAMIRRAFRLARNRFPVQPSIEMLQGEKHNARKVFFSEAEYMTLRKHLPDDMRRVIDAAWILGWRVPSEILTRERRHVLADRIILEPGETKDKAGRFYPLTPDLRAILAEQEAATVQIEKRRGIRIPYLFHHEGEPMVVRNNRGTVKTTKYFANNWTSACKAAGLVGRIPHDFRRSKARRLRDEGYDIEIGMKLLGHKTDAMYKRYGIITDDDIFREVEKRIQNRSQGLVKVEGKKA